MDAIHPRLQSTYDALSQDGNLAVDSVLVEALPDLEPLIRGVAVRVLLERGNATQLVPLIGRFSGFDPELQQQLLANMDGLASTLRKAISSESDDARLGAVEIIRVSENTQYAYLLACALPRRCPRTSTAAARVLEQMTHDVVERSHSATGQVQRREMARIVAHLAEAINEAIESWQSHFRGEILRAAMWLGAYTEAELFKQAGITRTHLVRALNESLGNHFSPMMASYAIRALQYPDLRNAAAHRIGTCTDWDFLLRLLDEAWITYDPEMARACGWLRNFAPLLENKDRWKELTTDQAIGAMRFVSLTTLPVDQKYTVFHEMLGHHHNPVREAALWHITRMVSPRTDRLLQRVVGWRDSLLSPIAARELFRRNPTGYRPDELVEQVAQSDETPVTVEEQFERAWLRFDVMTEEERKSEIDHLLQSDDRFDSILKARLRSDEAEERIRALIMIGRSDRIAPFALEIYAAGHASDEKSRSIAVGLMSKMKGATADRIMQMALHDYDQRVQANAVEALESADSDQRFKLLAPKLEADNNRVKANAVKALLPLRARDAAEALIHMIQDDQREHRLSALWVIEELGLQTLLQRVIDLAAEDPDDVVRAKAAKLLSTMGHADHQYVEDDCTP